MRLRLIALGNRMPAWVEAGFNEYARRLRGAWRLELIELPLARRASGGSGRTAGAKAEEGQRVLAALSTRDFIVPLDEHGVEPSSAELARWLEERRAAGRDLAFIIGGPDGLADGVLERAHFRWSLSRLTLPHGLARVLLAEQLYRAASLLAGHPYHRASP
jgi:23S rRNA (pseudouridine1915-N3)-methyltransferase